MKGETPSVHAVENAVKRMRASWKKQLPTTSYSNCRRKSMRTDEEKRRVVDFVKRWRSKRFCLSSVKFPPNSGDLNPIETVWARLRRDLAVREMADLKAGRA